MKVVECVDESVLNERKNRRENGKIKERQIKRKNVSRFNSCIKKIQFFL